MLTKRSLNFVFKSSSMIFIVTEEDTSVVVGQDEEDGEEDVEASTEGRGVALNERQKQESRCKCPTVNFDVEHKLYCKHWCRQ